MKLSSTYQLKVTIIIWNMVMDCRFCVGDLCVT